MEGKSFELQGGEGEGQREEGEEGPGSGNVTYCKLHGRRRESGEEGLGYGIWGGEVEGCEFLLLRVVLDFDLWVEECAQTTCTQRRETIVEWMEKVLEEKEKESIESPSD